MLFLSIRPQFAAAIALGAKTVELRRLTPRCAAGEFIAIYASSPDMELLGVARVGGVLASSPELIWQRFREQCGVSRQVFDEYFIGAKKAVAIQLTAFGALQRPVPLVELRDVWRGFIPPQGFRYLTEEQIRAVPEINQAIRKTLRRAA